MTPADFIAKWSRAELSERAASQEHFIDLCRLLGQPTPAEHDATGEEYTFEKGVRLHASQPRAAGPHAAPQAAPHVARPPSAGPARGAPAERGFADVWWRGKFGWEYKRKGRSLDE